MEHFRLFLESPLWQSGTLITLIIFAVFYTRMSGEKLLDFGVHLALAWLFIMLFGSWISTEYWSYLGRGFIAITMFFSCWLLLLNICERYGQPYLNKGGLAVFLPVSMIPHIVVLSLLGRGLMTLL
jgi:hypothetical protein